MKLYEVTNGYRGFTDLRVLVVAPNEELAKALASDEFKNDATNEYMENEIKYSEDYWTDLEAELLCDNLTDIWVSEIND